MAISEYRFGNFRLVPATRELWRDGELVHAPRRGFDCLAYLIEHRERAVGRDEMVAALWGRVDVTDSQVNQVVLRARLAVGDDGQAQRAIRTVPGFGYRWVVPVEAIDATEHETSPAAVAGDATSAPAAAPVPAPPGRHRGRWRSMLGVALLGSAAAAAWLFWPMRSTPTVETPRTALVVLPLEVPAANESGWIRLGAMDLAAERLRGAGLAVPPSDSVVAAVHAVGEPLDAGRRQTLQKTLGAAIVVQGKASRSANGWSVELEAQDGDGTRHRTTADQADVIEATRQAADLLAAALGRRPAPGDEREGDGLLRAALQRAQAALLANQLDTARSILAALPEPLRADAQVRARLAQIDFRAGDLERARTTLDALLADPELAPADVRAQALTTRGFIDIRQEDCTAAETRFDGAASLLHEHASRQRGIALAARGLARACLHRFDAAAADLGAARMQLIAAGDRLGNARVDNYFGILETQRHRLAEAMAYFTAAAAANEAFGVVEAMRANLHALFLTQAKLLRWQDALATSTRLRALQPRIGDPALLVSGNALHATALTALGRQREADALLAETAARWPDAHGELTRFAHLARAELALQRGDGAAADAEAARASSVWPPRDDDDAEERAHLNLLRQRASILAGTPHAAQVAPGPDGDPPPSALLARAEWALHEGLPAEADLRAAWSKAEADGVPEQIAHVARTYVDWLIGAGRLEEAGALAGRVAPWSAQDFECALLQLRLFHDAGEVDAWAAALRQAQGLAGERAIPAPLLKAPLQAGKSALASFATDANVIRGKAE